MVFSMRMSQESKLWKQLNKKNLSLPKISSTEVATLFAMNSNKSRNQLFLEKTGKRERPDVTCAAIEHGRRWEGVAVSQFMDHHFREDEYEFLHPGTVLHDEEDVCFSPDMMFNHRFFDLLIGLETKCNYSRPIPKRKEDVPIEHIFQCFHCLMISEADYWFLSYHNAWDGTSTVFQVDADDLLWEETIIPKVREFLETVRRAQILPEGSLPFKRKGKEEKELEEKVRGKLLALVKRRQDMDLPYPLGEE